MAGEDYGVTTVDGPAPRDVRVRPSAGIVRPALLGFLAIVAIVAGASQPGSPFALKQGGAWFFGIPQPGAGGGVGEIAGLVAVFGGVAALLVAWFQMVREVRSRPGSPVRSLVPVLLLWTVPLMVAPPLFSRDVYSYAAQGDMVSHGISPYKYGTDILGSGPYPDLVDPLWSTVATPYGPMFLALAGVAADVTLHHELGTVVAMRVLEVLALVLIAWFLPQLARLCDGDAAEAFALGVLNPLVLLDLVGGAHNDAMTVGLLIAGLVMAKRGRPILGIVLCTLAAAVKFPAGLAILYIGWDWIGGQARWKDRIRPLLTSALIGFGVMDLLGRVTDLGWGWLGALGTPGTVRSLQDPASAAGMIAGDLLGLLGLGSGSGAALAASRGLGEALAVALCVVMFLASSRIGAVKALALSLLAVVILGPVIQPWYLLWGLLLLVPIAGPRGRALVVGLTIMAVTMPLQYAPAGFAELGVCGMVAGLAIVIGVVIPYVPAAEPLRLWLLRARSGRRFAARVPAGWWRILERSGPPPRYAALIREGAASLLRPTSARTYDRPPSPPLRA